MRYDDAPQSNQAVQLLQHIEHNPAYSDLVAQAAAECSQPPKKRRPKFALGKRLLSLCIADSDEFHGTAYVTPQLKQQAQVTARVVSASSLLDFATNWPLLFFAFKDLGALAFPISLLTNAILLKFTNDTAAATSSRHSKNGKWSKAAAFGLVGMNALQSAVSGVGIELLNNQPMLNQQMAGELIQSQIAGLEDLKTLDAPQYQAVKERCETGEQEFSNMDLSNPRRDSLFTQLYGQWLERNVDRSQLPLEQLPICEQVERLEKEAFQAYEQAKAWLEEKLIDRSKIGNDVAFLRQEMPEVYESAFDEYGNIKSGVEAVRIATENFFGKLATGEFKSLGFSLFFFSLSVVTSTAATWMTIAYARREDVQLSRSQAVIDARDKWLEERWREWVDRSDK